MHTQSSPLGSHSVSPHHPHTLTNLDDAAQHGALSQHEPVAEALPDADVGEDDCATGRTAFILPPSVVADRQPRRRARTARQAAASARNQDEEGDSDEEDTTCWVENLPAEALQRVFQHLDPLSLARCTLVSRSWSHVARDDATWRLAFATSYGTSIGLRRISKASSWKQEYIRRTDVIRRWRKSRSPAITSDMRVSNITSIAYSASHNFMLATSIAYGIASRSDPFKGKVARGFVDAAGVLNGAGIGNPNAEFSPDVTALDVACEASRLAWGFRDGTVALTLLTRQGSNPRGMIRSVRFALRGAHAGPVNAIAFDLNKPGQERSQKARAELDEDVGETLVTGGEDGVVKLWTPLRAVPLWVSGLPAAPATPGTLASAAPVVKVDYDADRGVIVAGTRNGSISMWSGVDARALLAISSHAWDDELSPELRSSSINDARSTLVTQHRNIKRKDVVLPGQAPAPIDQVFLDAVGGSILVHREQDTCLFHVGLPGDDGDEPALTTLQPAGVDVSAGKITCLRADCAVSSGTQAPSSASTPPPSLSSPNVLGPLPGSLRNLDTGVFAERRFVVAGTDDGKLVAWHLPSPSTNPAPESISPSFALDCHHTPLTSVDFTPHCFAVGCSDGTIKAFDALSGHLLRTWNDRTATRHPARMLAAGQLTQDEAARFFVRQIIVGEESIVAAVGPHVLAWKAETALSGMRKRNGGVLVASGLEGVAGSSNSSSNGSPAPLSGRSSRNAGGLPPLSKYAQMREIKIELAESATLLSAEREQRQASYERLRFARGPAETGGLTEQEALEYAMMLSRDEEEARQASKAEQVSGLTELTRLRREEAELQQALEQIELAEGGGVGDESCFTVSSQVSERGVDDDEEEEEDDGYSIHRSYERPPSPTPSPALSASSPRAWNIVHNNANAGNHHHLSTSSSSASRWGEASKVRTISVPRSARSPSSSGQGPPPPSSLQSPEHWPAMGTSLSSRVGSPLRLDDAPPSPWSSAPSPPASSDRGKGKGPARDGGMGSSDEIAVASSTVSHSPGEASDREKGKGRMYDGIDDAHVAPSSASSELSPSSGPSSHPQPARPGPKVGGAWAKGSPAAWRQHTTAKKSPAAAAGIGIDGGDDEALQFAIELSLAEEESRRESWRRRES